MGAHLSSNEVRHSPGSANNNLCCNTCRISWKVIFDRVFCLHVGEFAHLDYDGHDLACKFSRGCETQCLYVKILHTVRSTGQWCLVGNDTHLRLVQTVIHPTQHR